jgi:DNA-binding IclR family transcriptional regulator
MMLAELHHREIDRIVDDHLPRSSKNTITDPGRLSEEISRILKRGFALSLGERDAEVSAISAAVRDPSTGGLGAISVSLPSNIVQRNDIVEEYAEPITQTASKLSLRLKHG